MAAGLTRSAGQNRAAKALRDVTGPGGQDRTELFVTTKLDGPYQGNGRAVGGLDASLRRLGLDNVDLLLIHWPLPERPTPVITGIADRLGVAPAQVILRWHFQPRLSAVPKSARNRRT